MQAERGSIYEVQAEERDSIYSTKCKQKKIGSIYAEQAERDIQYLRSASRKRQAVSTQCKQKERDSIHEVWAERDRQYIYAMQAEEVDVFYAVKKEGDVLIKDTLYWNTCFIE